MPDRVISPATNSVIERLIRLGGVGGIIGGVALAAAYLAHPSEAPPETVASGLWIWVHAGFMLSLITGIFLLLALLDRYFRAGGGLSGFIGFAMATVSLVLVFGLDYSEVFIFPTLAVEFPSVVERYGDGTMMPSVAFAFPLTGVLFLAGFVLFGWQLYRVGAVNKGAAMLTIVGTIVFGIGLSGILPMIVVRTGSVIFGAGLVWLGVSLRKISRR
jgi:hypothetical protein